MYVMEGTCSDLSKKTKQECDNANETWTFEIEGDDGSNGYWTGNNCDVCSSNSDNDTHYILVTDVKFIVIMIQQMVIIYLVIMDNVMK